MQLISVPHPLPHSILSFLPSFLVLQLDHDLCYFDKGKHGMGLGVKSTSSFLLSLPPSLPPYLSTSLPTPSVTLPCSLLMCLLSSLPPSLPWTDGVRHPWTRLALAFLRREHLLREGGGEDEEKEEVPREDKRRHGPWGQYICTGIP